MFKLYYVLQTMILFSSLRFLLIDNVSNKINDVELNIFYKLCVFHFLDNVF